jgi:two-component system, LuxR family, sensor kinase FixL
MRQHMGHAASAAGSSDHLDDRVFRTHFDNLPGPAFMWRREGDDFRLIAHNRAGAAIGNRRMGPFIGGTASELYGNHPDILADLRACAAAGKVLRREAEYEVRGGESHTFIATCVPLSADTVVAHIEDVTEQRAAVRAVAESEARIRALFESNPDVVFRMDADATFLDVHVPAKSYFPWTREQLIGRTVGDVYGEEAHRDQVKHNRNAIRTGVVQVFEYRLSLGGVIANLESRVARAGHDEVVVSVRDISDRVDVERRLTLIGERERNRIGREIHDGLAQMLTGAKLLLELLERRLREAGSQHASEAGQAVELINGTIGQARELVRGLSPIPEGTSLFKALELLASQSAKCLGVQCRASCACAGSVSGLGEAAVAHLYRIAQEAITNAVRHGGATAIELGCMVDDSELVLRIADNGSGFGEPPPRSDGLGLKIMRYRARAIGGEIAITRRAEGGTLVTCNCMRRALVD